MRPRDAVRLPISLCAVAAGIAFACDPVPPEPTTPAQKQRPPDVTEVTMEVTPFDAGGTEGIGPPPAAATAQAPEPEPSEDPNIGGPQEPYVEKAVAPIRSRLRACYKKALSSEPKLAGKATFDTTIGKDGHVSAARFVKREGLNEDMVGCLLAAVKGMTFDPGRKSQIVTLSFGRPEEGAPAPAAAPADAGAQ
jgi:hypothetical protein